MMILKDPADTHRCLTEAAEQIAGRGWLKGQFYREPGPEPRERPCCLSYALIVAEGGITHQGIVVDYWPELESVRLLGELAFPEEGLERGVHGPRRLVPWNDRQAGPEHVFDLVGEGLAFCWARMEGAEK